MMRFHTWWENTGCAPLYRPYDLALQLRSDRATVTLKTDADITGWLPGDAVYDGEVPIPYDLPDGQVPGTHWNAGQVDRPAANQVRKLRPRR